MRRNGRRPGFPGPDLRARPAAWGVALVAFVAMGLAATSPSALGAERLAIRLAAAVKSMPRRAPVVPPAMLHGRLYNGTPAVGALFTTSGGSLRQHFCTASVVASRVKDLVITAAHCLSGKQPGDVDFVPDYHRHHEPYGTWTVTQVFVDAAWASSANPNDDVAFLVVTQSDNPTPIQDLTGGETLATGWRAAQLVRVIGYPGASQRPITCTSRTRAFGAHQMEFDCGGYTNGTSGGPFLANVHKATGLGTVIGVIGGYEQGGDTPSVSYSPRFGKAVRALYNKAVATN
ncbi:MAG TPA: trypsin-like serine protease [Streptosporangiaceae bacterium]|nr:trypsin-like serine protease [Streptosporangiaceae bacterium]